jgi:hypothetical protein
VRDLINSLELDLLRPEDKDHDHNKRGNEPMLTDRVAQTNSMRMSQDTLSYVGRDRETLDPRGNLAFGA